MERIPTWSVSEHHAHRLRYHLARGLCGRNDTVLDAACGVGYGSYILSTSTAAQIVAIDKEPVARDYVDLAENVEWVTADLNTSERDQACERVGTFDVSVSFETIEHLNDPAEFVRWLCEITDRTIVTSVPVVPITHLNEYHFHDFERDDLPAMFAAQGWPLAASFDQPDELSVVYVFGIF